MDDISLFVANWNDKATNIKYISEKLNIGLDSIVFIDDNEFEQDYVKNRIPEVTVINGKNPFQSIESIHSGNYFEVSSISEEDLSRTESIQALINQNQQINDSSKDLQSYLISLDMRATSTNIDESNINRAEQLLIKTNQFELTSFRPSKMKS